jgi:hypothetical protein
MNAGRYSKGQRKDIDRGSRQQTSHLIIDREDISGPRKADGLPVPGLDCR